MTLFSRQVNRSQRNQNGQGQSVQHQQLIVLKLSRATCTVDKLDDTVDYEEVPVVVIVAPRVKYNTPPASRPRRLGSIRVSGFWTLRLLVKSMEKGTTVDRI